MRAALVQMTASDDPGANLVMARALVARAAGAGAQLVCTPENTNCMSSDRAHQAMVLRHEDDDPTLAGLRDAAARHGIWLSVGSLGLKVADEARFANRSFLIDPTGGIAARYDKIHMFDVVLGEGETYAESSAFRPGDRAVVVDVPLVRIGLTICYDLRFPHLHRALAKAGAGIILNPSAFTVPTGSAHWEVLLRARAIESGAFILAAAQTGSHPRRDTGPQRRTWGHSLAVSPWGEVLADAGTEPGVVVVDLDLAQVAEARRRIPALAHDRVFAPPG
ncbi:MAG: carbon-nitrogen hydrolase family protein [Rubellimicrobium sp.]|nr:carbon-nitrogen hydrolase family protein [Rubellimicrobium sp.]